MFNASKRTLILALAVTAVAAPSTASARLVLGDPVSGSGSNPQSIALTSQPVQASQPSSGAFEWGDAGIGAAAATVALMGAGGIVVGGRRRRGHTARVG
jgi:hypothetical protein